MKAIETKFFGPGNVRGSRMKASAEGVKSIYIDYDHALSNEKNHRQAAETLSTKMRWDTDRMGRLIGGGTKAGYAFVFTNSWI